MNTTTRHEWPTPKICGLDAQNAGLQPIAVRGPAWMMLPTQCPVPLVADGEPLYRDLQRLEQRRRPRKCQRRCDDQQQQQQYDGRRVNRSLLDEFERCLH